MLNLRPLDKKRHLDKKRKEVKLTKETYVPTETTEAPKKTIKHKKMYFKTLEQIALSSPRKKEDTKEGAAMKNLKKVLAGNYFEQKRKMGGSIDVRDV